MNAIKLAAMLATNDMAFAAPDAAASIKFTFVLLYNKEKQEENLTWTEVCCVGSKLTTFATL